MNEIKESNDVNWLEDELKQSPATGGDFEKLPSPVFADGVITYMKVDATVKFKDWTDQENGKVKAIIPCVTLIDGKLQKANWWLNKQNPVYKEVIRKCRDAPDKARVDVAIMQTGTKQNTKYTLVKG